MFALRFGASICVTFTHLQILSLSESNTANLSDRSTCGFAVLCQGPRYVHLAAHWYVSLEHAIVPQFTGWTNM